MITSPITPLIAAACLIAIPCALRAQEPNKIVQEAGAHFKKSCMGCHVPPDLRFATDRSWLAQIRETA